MGGAQTPFGAREDFPLGFYLQVRGGRDGRPEAGAQAGLRPGRSSRPCSSPLPGRRRRRRPDALGGRACLPVPRPRGGI